MTAEAAAKLLGCSIPHFVKLVEEGNIPFTLVGRHRRVKLKDVMDYKTVMKVKQEQLLIDMMKSDEELGLYES